MKTKSLFVLILAALLLAACGGGQSQEEPVVSEPVQAEQQAAVVEEPVVEEPVAEEPAVAEPVVEEPVVQEPAPASGGTAYTSPKNIFTLDVPAGWAQSEDTTTIEDSTIHTFTAPDGHAYVQVLVNEISPDTSAVLKAQYTRDYMKRLCGSDMRFASDVTLDDGREELVWWSDQNVTSGIAYFDTKDTYLYILNVYYEDAYEDTYLPVLVDVTDSFALK
jgi:hypothetical protein